MKKTKSESNKTDSISKLGQKTGSSLDIKTNEDFNNEHPDHDVSGKLKGISNPKAVVKEAYTKQQYDKK